MPRPSLALLHGFTGHADSWDVVQRELGPRADVAALTAYGHDFERPARERTTFEDEVARITTWLRPRAPVRLCGYSMGGRLALGVLCRTPELLHSVVLIGASPGLATEAERAERRAADAVWTQRLRAEGIAAFADAWQQVPLFASQSSLPKAILDRQRAARLRHDPESLALSMESLGLGSMPSYWDLLGDMDVPVTLVVGGLDAKFRDLASRMRARLRKSEIVEVQDVGHNIVLEAPSALARTLATD